MNPSSKYPTVAQIAREAGVSPSTVSRVLNHQSLVKEETYQAVVEVLKSHGYPFQEKQNRASARNNVLIINAPALDNPFYNEIIRGAKAGALRHGYHLLINEDFLNHNTLARFLEILRKVSAVGVITLNSIPLAILKEISSRIPLVQCCEFNDEIDLPYVSIDDFEAGKIATEHLISHGCKRIAFLSGPMEYKYARYRQKGYNQALLAAGIEPDPNLVVTFPEINYELAIASTMQLLRTASPPDGFVTTSDVYAASVIRGAHLVGMRIPQDLKVIGFDNIDISAMTIPSLTTIDQPQMRLGLMACELLIEKITSPSIPNKTILLDTELIVRESTSLSVSR